MGLRGDERDTIERRFVPLDPVQDEDFIPNPPMAKTYRGRATEPCDPVPFVPLEDSLVLRGAGVKRVSASRQAAEEGDRLSRDLESFKMVREGLIITTKLHNLKQDSHSSASGIEQPHNRGSLKQDCLQASYPQAHPCMIGMNLE